MFLLYNCVKIVTGLLFAAEGAVNLYSVPGYWVFIFQHIGGSVSVEVLNGTVNSEGEILLYA